MPHAYVLHISATTPRRALAARPGEGVGTIERVVSGIAVEAAVLRGSEAVQLPSHRRGSVGDEERPGARGRVVARQVPEVACGQAPPSGAARVAVRAENARVSTLPLRVDSCGKAQRGAFPWKSEACGETNASPPAAG
jgi:hypothetical protein